MDNLIKNFKARMKTEGRSFKWFHRVYLRDITYPYFIIQLNEPDRLHDGIKQAIEKFLKED